MKHQPFIIDHKNPHWRSVLDRAIAAIRELGVAGNLVIKLSDVIRSLDQNSKMWPMLTDFAKQIPWPVNGARELIDPEDWKAILTAAFEQEARMAPGIRGGFVMLGARTSKYTRRKMAEFITFMYAEGNERGVQWTEKSREHIVKYGAAQARTAAQAA